METGFVEDVAFIPCGRMYPYTALPFNSITYSIFLSA